MTVSEQNAKCPKCNGTGKTNTWDLILTCDLCKGKGKVNE
jgi:DnaJ-class molecular chaperone